MIEVVCLNWEPNKAIDVVKDMRLKGYTHGEDFDFKYYPPVFNSYAWEDEPIQERKVVFFFYREELASWFELRYK